MLSKYLSLLLTLHCLAPLPLTIRHAALHPLPILVPLGHVLLAQQIVCIPDTAVKLTNSLASDNDVIVIEGAGSPAEINLRENDIVNMGLAKLVGAPVLLAGDIDRGGVFAQLYGTAALLETDERERIKGLIINKFRGDADILRPGLTMLEEKTGVPVLGVVPYLKVDIDDEDSLAPGLEQTETHKPLDVAVIRLPRISNFTDFAPLETHPLIGVRYVQRTGELGKPDILILPGTKSTMSDLLWLRQSGLETAVLKLARNGTPVLGICGGYQMLGRSLHDPTGTEGGGPEPLRGLELLPVDTVFDPQKTRTRVQGVVLSGHLSGAHVDAYEIHTGQTTVNGLTFCRLDGGRYDGCVSGNICGTYLHGLFDTGEATEALARSLCEQKGIDYTVSAPLERTAYLNKQYDILAGGVRSALDMDAVYRILEAGA